MMIYSIRDDVAQFFIAPFLAENDAHAKRMFIGSMGDSFPHRSDFKLYRVGSFDPDNGTVTPEDPALVLAGFSIPIDLDPRAPQHQPSTEKADS